MNILITGGASGLGLAITRKLASEGHRVYFTYNTSSAAAKALTEEYPRCTACHCDFAESGSLERLLDALPAMELGGLINNALASLSARQFQKYDISDLAKSFALNVVPLLRLTQGVIASFRTRKFGRIVTILTSYLMNRPPVGYSEYVANKAYLLSMSKSWAAENAKYNITSNCVSPSTMKTGLTAEVDERFLETIAAANPMGRLVEPPEVAEIVAFMLGASPQLNAINMLVNGGENVI